MLSFVQNFLAPRANPIGVDFGTDSLRLAQVQWTGEEFCLIAAASADVPLHLRGNPAARMAFFVETTRDLLAQSNFKSRQAVLALPASAMYIQHLRLPKMDEESLKKSLPFELAGKIPIDPSVALLRHLVAGEVYVDNEPRQEVVTMAASRERIEQFLAAASKARLDVVGMNIESMAIVDCFHHIYRRKNEPGAVWCIIDIGCGSTRVTIAQGEQISFARSIPIGSDHLIRAVAHEFRVSLDQARLMRINHCQEPQPNTLSESSVQASSPPVAESSGEPSEEESFALLDAAMAQSRKQVSEPASAACAQAVLSPQAPAASTSPRKPDPSHVNTRRIEQACREPLNRLIDEMNLCRRYHEATFPNRPVERLMFVGGEARQRGQCQYIAQKLGLAAQVGDPMTRMSRISQVGIETGIDRRQTQPAWAVAIGLSMGPASASTKA